MSEMVERVARAIVRAGMQQHGMTDADLRYDPAFIGICTVAGLDARALARAAIAAMREPTFDPEAVNYSQDMTRADWWRAMIDAALTPSASPDAGLPTAEDVKGILRDDWKPKPSASPQPPAASSPEPRPSQTRP